MLAEPLGLIGAGQMALALAQGWVRAGLARPEQFLAADPNPRARELFCQQLPGAKFCDDNLQLLDQAPVILLAVKPQSTAPVLAQLQVATEHWSASRQQPLLLSIVAGWTLARLQREFSRGRWIRIMPNTPCLVGESASAYSVSELTTPADAALAQKLFGAVGQAFKVPENLLDAVTGLSGSGPAYVMLMIEALADGGVRMGLPRDVALALAAQTVRGSASLQIQTGEHPAVLKDRVASPGGTTIAGLAALESHGLRSALIEAVSAATRRAAELSAM
ncbi:MAG: pyrroline-5-carboxylate reductase [Pirellulales bacterium]|nr:pyrroline-5-carboxylate reductase [Pirellulales bacterium]